MARPIIAALLLLFPFSAHSQTLPDAPKPKPEAARKLDRRIFWTGTALLGASFAADMVTTRYTLDTGPGAWEYNPVYGHRPSIARQTAVSGLIFAGEIFLFRETERNRHRWVRWAGRAAIAFDVVNHAQLAACGAGNDTVPTHMTKCRDWQSF